MTSQADILSFYRRQGRMTDPGRHAAAIDALPRDPGAVARIAQGLVLHEHWSGAYGQTLSDTRRAEVHIRSLPAMLDQALSHDQRPLSAPRRLEDRLIGNCRDFSLFTTAVLRAHGVAARARCGFATYFDPDQRVDHWLCEHWSPDEGRWVMTDAQIDALQAARIRPDFDVLDTPADRFLTAGAAWRAWRSGAADAERFGIMDMHGPWFIAGNLVRDAAALAGTEMLPWDCWGAMPQPGDAIDTDGLAWFDHLAELTRDPDQTFDALIAVNRDDDRQRLPPVVFNAVRGGPETV